MTEGTIRAIRKKAMHCTRSHFEMLVKKASAEIVGSLPEELRSKARHVLICAADAPSPGEEDYGEDLLGLYEGTPLPERFIDQPPVLPDRITLFRKPLTAVCDNEWELREEIRATIIHELGHFFGFTEEELEERGLP